MFVKKCGAITIGMNNNNILAYSYAENCNCSNLNELEIYVNLKGELGCFTTDSQQEKAKEFICKLIPHFNKIKLLFNISPNSKQD